MTDPSTVSAFLAGEPRALGRLISSAENGDLGLAETLASLFPKVGRARVIGITGPPGAGKSSLTGAFIQRFRAEKKTVAVVAIDPISPFTGGALLGDRIRLQEHFTDPGVYIRSLSTRGKLGGLSTATRQVVHLLDAFGFDAILLETVGVGQSEVDVRHVADATLVVLVPEWGDAVQTLKSGVLEIADLFVVNKADREGADRLAGELKTVLQISHKDDVPVLTSSLHDPASLDALFSAVQLFFTRCASVVAERRRVSSEATARQLLEAFVLDEARTWLGRQAAPGVANPYRFIVDFMKTHPKLISS